MNIWILQTGEPIHVDEGHPRPMRAMNLANIMIARGHRVTLWTSDFDHINKRHRTGKFSSILVRDSLTVNLIPSVGYAKNIGLARMLDHGVLAWRLSMILRKNRQLAPDVAFIGYPPIETSAVMIRWLSKRGIPSVLDVKDQWPSLFIEHFATPIRPFAKIAFYPYFVLARYAMRKATAFCSMSRSFLEWMGEASGRSVTSRDMVIPLTTPQFAVPEPEIAIAADWWREQGVTSDSRRRFCFIGSLSPAFDFSPIKRVAKIFLDEGVQCQFVICGDGGDAEAVRAMMSGLPNVVMPGWIDAPKISALTSMCTGALAPYLNTQNFSHNIPNKIVDSFSHGLPVLTSLTGEVKAIVKDEGVGICYETDADLYKALQLLLDDFSVQKSMSQKALSLYKRRFSFEFAYGLLASNLERLAVV
jgi:glycosyltransferase involved in cell wall biosynthesis